MDKIDTIAEKMARDSKGLADPIYQSLHDFVQSSEGQAFIKQTIARTQKKVMRPRP